MKRNPIEEIEEYLCSRLERYGLNIREIISKAKYPIAIYKANGSYPFFRVYLGDEKIDYIDFLPNGEIAIATFPILYEGEPVSIPKLNEEVREDLDIYSYFELIDEEYNIGILSKKLISRLMIFVQLTDLRRGTNEKLTFRDILDIARKVISAIESKLKRYGKIYWPWEDKYIETVTTYLI